MRSIRQHIQAAQVTFLMVLLCAICCVAFKAAASLSPQVATGSYSLAYYNGNAEVKFKRDFHYLIPSGCRNVEIQSEAEFVLEEEDSNEKDNAFTSAFSDHLGNVNFIYLTSSCQGLFFKLVSLIQLYILYHSLRIFIV